MSVSTSQDAGVTALQTDIAALKRDVASLIEHLKTGVTHGVQGAAARVDGGSRRLYRTASAEGGRALKVVGGQVEERPLVALLIALGVGYIGGRVLTRRSPSRLLIG
jgi:hypothetical protein